MVLQNLVPQKSQMDHLPKLFEGNFYPQNPWGQADSSVPVTQARQVIADLLRIKAAPAGNGSKLKAHWVKKKPGATWGSRVSPLITGAITITRLLSGVSHQGVLTIQFVYGILTYDLYPSWNYSDRIWKKWRSFSQKNIKKHHVQISRNLNMWLVYHSKMVVLRGNMMRNDDEPLLPLFFVDGFSHGF